MANIHDAIKKDSGKFKPTKYRAWEHNNSVTQEDNSSNLDLNNKVETENQIININTELCVPWSYSDRSNEDMGNIEELAKSIKNHGQQEPALVRKLKEQNNEAIYEIIFGHRRWLACKLAGTKLLAITKTLNDQQAAIAQKEENENREDLSDYSKALNYKQLLDNNVFKNIRELATKMGIGKTTLSDILAYTRIPNELIEIIEPHRLSRNMAVKIATITANMSDNNICKLKEMLPDVISGKISINKVEDILNTHLSIQVAHPAKVFKNKWGVELFSSRTDSNGSPIFVIRKNTRDLISVEEIENTLFELLKEKTEENKGY